MSLYAHGRSFGKERVQGVVGQKLFPISELYVHQADTFIKIFKFPWEYSMEKYKANLNMFAILYYENKIKPLKKKVNQVPVFIFINNVDH